MTEQILDRDHYEDLWIERFIILNQRKPSRLEKMSFRVGFNAGESSDKQKVQEVKVDELTKINDKANKEKIDLFDWAMHKKEFSYWIEKYEEEHK